MPLQAHNSSEKQHDSLNSKVSKLEGIVNALWDWIFTVDRSYNILEVFGSQNDKNPLFSRDIVGKNLTEIIPTAHLIRMITRVDDAFEGANGTMEWKYQDSHFLAYFQSTITPMIIRGEVDAVLVISRDISDVEIVREQTEVQWNYLETIINHAPLAIFAKDLYGKYTMVNDYYCRLMRRNRSALLGENIEVFREEEFSKRVMIQEKRVLQKGIPARYESWIDDGSKRLLLYDIIKVPVKDGKGEIIGLIGIGRNITKLRDIEQRLKLAMDIAREFIMEWNFTLNSVQFGSDFYRLMDYNSGSFDGPFINAFNHLVFKEDRADVIRWMRNQDFSKGNMLECETRLKHADGGTRWFVIRGQVTTTDAKMTPRHAIFILIDITEIKAMQVELKGYNQQLNQLISSVPGVVFTGSLDRKNGLSYISPKCMELFGYSDKELISDPDIFNSLVVPDYYDKVMHERDISSEEGSEYEVKYKARTKAGNLLWVWEKGKIRGYDPGRKAKVIDGIMMDITEAMQIEERISSATIQAEEKERKRLAQEIHDSVQQILISSLFHFRSMEDEVQNLNYKSYKKFQQGISYIEDAIREARTVSHNLVPNTIYDFGLHETISSLVQEISNASDIDVEFTQNIKGRRFDERLELNVYRIIQESVNNVLKYAQTRELCIRVNCIREKMYIQVVDKGVGFDTGSIKALNSFGLSSMHNRTNSLNGTMSIESRKGKGTKISVEIPLS